MAVSRSNRAASKPKSVRAFGRLARDYYAETFERFPVGASEAGVARLHGSLGRATPATFERQARLARKTLRAIEQAPIHDFEGEDWLDRLTLSSRLRQELMDLEDLKDWQTNPQIYLDRVAGGIFTLLIRNGDNLRPVAEPMLRRLRAIPRFLDEAAGCIRLPVPLWTELARESAPGICDLLLALPEPLSRVTPHSEETIGRWAKLAASSIRTYARRIGRKTPGAEGGFAVGRDRFETLIRERLGLNLTAREAVAAAGGLSARLKAELRTEARKFHRRKSAAEILAEAAQQWRPDGRSLISAYAKQMLAIKRRFRQAGVMSFPKGDRLLVKAVPKFMMNQFPTAAYSAPGALERNQTGIFWVNDLSKIRSSDREKAKEIAQHFGMELTSAHEAYPGHHLQFVTQHRHPSLVRKLADHSIYYEGWTLWCEQMSVDLKVSDNPYLKLIQLHDALWRANRIVIDCGLQTGELSYGGACRRLQREVGFTAARARADVNWYTSSPTIPMSYLLGKMELLRLKRARVDRGDWSLKQFNNWVLKFGAIPWSWIEASGL